MQQNRHIRVEIDKILNFYGEENQLNQATEELAELIVAINKYKRKKENARDNVIEEIADVENMIEQIKAILSIDDGEVDLIKKDKIKRQIERIKNGESRGN